MKYYCIDEEFGIDGLSLREKDDPRPGHKQVLVKMKAASINYRDILMIQGLYDPRLQRPRIPFSDGAGEVLEIGPDVHRWKVGDRVASTFFGDWRSGNVTYAGARSGRGGDIDGVLADYVLFEEEGLVEIPDHLSFGEGATLPCAGVTAWNALTAGGSLAGETVLTLGTGGVSIFAVQLAVASGMRVIGTSGHEAKLDRLKEMGVSHTINYRNNPQWEEEVLEATDGVGVDRVIEIGGAGTLARSIRATRIGGHVSLIGVLAGPNVEGNPFLPAVMKAIHIQGILVGSCAMFEAMNKAIALHRIKPVIDRTFSFDEVRQALKYQLGQAHFGKVVITI
jgi:NADPH:quinone reductase-like Zn-dependent oxidoreductase